MHPAHDIDGLIVELSDPACRVAAAGRLAQRLGVDQVVLLVRDVRLGVLLPATGMPRTLPGGDRWRHLLQALESPGCHRARVDLPPGTDRDVVALASGTAAMVFVGAEPLEEDRARIELLMPLLDALLVAENRAADARAEAMEAFASAQRATSLATALEAARAEASRLNAQLREEHERKDDFLAMLAHELRNPLAPITHSVEILRNPRVTVEIRSRLLDVLERQAKQLSRLVEDLLDVSRVSRGRIELRREQIDVRDVLQAAVDTTRPVLDTQRHQLHVSLPDARMPVSGDSQRLTQVFSNLLHNAAKYTEAGGRVDVHATIERDTVVVAITDTGIGIDASMLGRVFDLFTQAPVALDRADGGLGIGLTLVRSLVTMHEGTVHAASEGTGRGSTFTVRLPCAAMPPAASQPEPAGTVSARGPTRHLRVLVVDDNVDAAQTLAQLLRLAGHDVRLAYSGADALQAVEAVRPELVLLDIGLPEVDGLEVARRLRETPQGRAWLVALTGYGSEADQRRSFDAGFDEHWVKPLQPEDLARIVANAIVAADDRVAV